MAQLITKMGIISIVHFNTILFNTILCERILIAMDIYRQPSYAIFVFKFENKYSVPLFLFQ